MRYIVAVSGGVDSVVLLDLLARSGEHELVVAHFDHDIRAESADDARFVEGLAEAYGLPFVLGRDELGECASEDLARTRRYSFLYEIAEKHQGIIATAHHRDDIIETIALNIQRGTRWRGLAGMNRERIARPLHAWTKQQIREYAQVHRLEWCEDATNLSNRYARNRVRRRLGRSLDDATKDHLYQLWLRQRTVRRQIEREVKTFDAQLASRYFLSNIDQAVAEELLYYRVKQLGISLLSRQLEAMWLAIKVGRAGTMWQISGAVRMKLFAKDVTMERVD